MAYVALGVLILAGLLVVGLVVTNGLSHFKGRPKIAVRKPKDKPLIQESYKNYIKTQDRD